LVDRAVAADPGSSELQAERSMMLAAQAGFFRRTGRFELALEPARASLAAYEQLVASEPNSRTYDLNLQKIRADLGRVLTHLGQLEESRDLLEMSAAGCRRMLAEDPTDAVIRVELSVAHHWLGRLLNEHLHDPEGAVEHFREMVRLREQTAADDPHSTTARRDVAVGRDMLGAALRGLGRTDEGLALHLSARQDFEELADLDSNNWDAQRSVAVSSYFLGEIYLELAHMADDKAVARRHREEARKWYVDGRAVMVRMRDEDRLPPGDAGVIDMLTEQIETCDRELEDDETTVEPGASP